MDNPKKAGVIFVMPRFSYSWRGAEALWITVTGWSKAAERKFGKAWVVTTDQIATPDQVALFPSGHIDSVSETRQRKRRFVLVPLWLRVLLKDLLLLRERNRSLYSKEIWGSHEIQFVWEQHDLFSGPGHRIARQLNVPFVLYVHAPVVWETAKWGVRRPIWGKLLEYFFERKSLLQADLVACVSPLVADQLKKMGVPESRIVVSPMAVDASLFQSDRPDVSVQEKFGLRNRTVIGWTGSFRGFHGLDTLLRIFSSVFKKRPNTKLVLVGDGSEREKMLQLAFSLGIQEHVVFAGKIRFPEIPRYLSVFDIAIVSANRADDFHYSPLKLREYLAARKATLAPRAGEIPSVFSDETDLLLYQVGNEAEIESLLLRLIDNPGLRERLGANGRSKILKSGTWDYELGKVKSLLDI